MKPFLPPLASAIVLAFVAASIPAAARAADFGASPPRVAPPMPKLPPPDEDIDLRQAYADYEGGHPREAYASYLRAARRGQPIGEYNVAMMMFNGEGTSVDVPGSVRWLRRAADAGFALAQYDLALLYESGTGVERSQVEATHWFLDAAEQGHVDAQLAVATQLLLGRGVAKDLAAAIHWYEEAATNGNVDAQYSLASFYEHGEGVPVDPGRALSWYAAAARQGDVAAIAKVKALSQPDADAR